MILESLKLINFRNYDQISINFEKGINYIVGPNGSGKTNLVEGIYYLSLARSFRTTGDENLIKIGKDYFYIQAKVDQDENRIIDAFCILRGINTFRNIKVSIS